MEITLHLYSFGFRLCIGAPNPRLDCYETGARVWFFRGTRVKSYGWMSVTKG